MGEGGIDLTVDLADHDPCEGHKCPKGDVCKVIIHPRLLQLPVPHCVQNGSREEGEGGGGGGKGRMWDRVREVRKGSGEREGLLK